MNINYIIFINFFKYFIALYSLIINALTKILFYGVLLNSYNHLYQYLFFIKLKYKKK